MFYCSKQKHGRGWNFDVFRNQELAFRSANIFFKKGGYTQKSIEHVEHVEHQQKHININIYNNIIKTITYLTKNHHQKTSNLFYM